MKRRYIFFIVLIVFVAIVIYKFIQMPSIDITYDYNGNSYIQNTKSLSRHKIILQGYNNITNIVDSSDGWFCHAKNSDDKGCFLYVTDNGVKEVIEDKCDNSFIGDSFIYKGKYSILYSYQKTDQDEPINTFLSIDFDERKLLYQTDPFSNAVGLIVSDGKSLWLSDGQNILKYSDEGFVEVTKGSFIIGTENNILLFEHKFNLYQLNLKTNEIIDCEYDIDVNEYQITDFISNFGISGNYIIGCKLGSKYADGQSIITHTSMFDIDKKKSCILFNSIGKIYKNINVVANTDKYTK